METWCHYVKSMSVSSHSKLHVHWLKIGQVMNCLTALSPISFGCNGQMLLQIEKPTNNLWETWFEDHLCQFGGRLDTMFGLWKPFKPFHNIQFQLGWHDKLLCLEGEMTKTLFELPHNGVTSPCYKFGFDEIWPNILFGGLTTKISLEFFIKFNM